MSENLFEFSLIYPEMERGAAALLAQFAKKNKDYGNSLGFHGTKGLMPRAADKFFRLNHMVWEDGTPNFESAIENAGDLVVYALALYAGLKLEKVRDELE